MRGKYRNILNVMPHAFALSLAPLSSELGISLFGNESHLRHGMRHRVGRIAPPMRFLCLSLLLATALASSPPAFAQDLKESVSKQVKPDDWLKAQKEANKEKWKEVESVSPEMAELLSTAEQSIAPKGNSGKPCDRAAANLAFSVIFDASSSAALSELLGSLKGVLSNILTAGELGEKDLAEWVAEQIKEKGKEWVKDYIGEKLSKDKSESFINQTTKAGCTVVLISIWNKAAGTYDVTVYGNCDCQSQLTGDYNRPCVKLRYFAVHAVGKVLIDIKDKVPIVRATPTTVMTEADCNCGVATEKPSACAPPQTTPAVAPEDPCKIKLQCPKPCKECEDIKKRIEESCHKMTEIDGKLRGLAGEVGGNKTRQEAARKAKHEEELKELQDEARRIEIEAHELGLEEQRLKQELKDLAQKLKDCEKKCCGPKESPDLNQKTVPDDPNYQYFRYTRCTNPSAIEAATCRLEEQNFITAHFNDEKLPDEGNTLVFRKRRPEF